MWTASLQIATLYIAVLEISGEKLTIKTVSVCVVFLCIAHTRKRVVLDLHGIYCMSTINAKQQLMGLKGTYVCYMNV